MPRDDLLNYWQLHAVAVRRAHRLARKHGVRYRVQQATWGDPWGGRRWHVAPTPAPAPGVTEPCS